MSKPPPSFRPDESFYGFTVRRPVAILMVVLAVAVFGAVSHERLALTLMPSMTYPTLTVRTMFPGTAPEEMETVVSRPLEQVLGIVSKLVTISSVSKAGQSDVTLEFQWKTDMDMVAQEVREKVDRIRFPDGAERPMLLHYDPSLDPIIRIGVAGPQSLYDLRYLAENEIKRKLETLHGVAAVKVKGGLEEQFLVAIDEARLASLKLDISQVGQRLQQGNVNLPGGNLREGQTEYLIRTLNEFRTVDEIGSVIVARQNGVDIRLRDVASISRSHKDRDVITRVNNRESVEVEVFKEADANVVQVASTVRAALFGRPDQQAYLANLKKNPPKSPEVLAKEKTAADAKAKAKAKADAKTKADAAAKEKPADSAKAEKTKADAAKTATAAAATAEMDRQRKLAMEALKHRQMTDFIAQQVPAGTSVQLLSDQSVFISRSIDEVQSNAIAGAIIAVIILYCFLRNVTQTIVIGLSIPISIVATFAPMYMAHVSLNIISLGGLALGVGMLVDNGIVVLESIFRCREEGDDLLTSVVRGTQEVGMAVISSTLTTVAVFLPIVFVEGVAGQVFGDMALTVVFSLLASLATALFFIPMLVSRNFEAKGDLLAAKSGEYLQFTPPEPGNRLRGLARLLGQVAVRLAFAVALILAVAMKFVAVVVFAAAFPLVALASTFVRPLRSWYAQVSAWAAADHFLGLNSSRVWPGMLSFTSLAHLAAGLSRTVAWTARRPRAWIPLRALPALCAFAFVLARCPLETLLRAVGSIAQTLGLALAQLLIGLGRVGGILLSPVSGPGLAWFEHGYRWLQDGYPVVIRSALRNRAAVLGSSAVAFLICWFLLVPRLGKELIPQVHQGEFNLDITLPIGAPIDRTLEVASRIEEIVTREPEVERTALTVGMEEGSTSTREAGEHTAQLTVRVKPGLTGPAELALIDRLRDTFRHWPEVKLELSYPTLFSFKSPIEVEVRGHDLETLKRLSREAETMLAERVPGLVDVRSTLQTGHPEIQVVYDRDRLSEFGLSLRNVADLVRHKVQGRVSTQFRKQDQMVDIVVRLDEKDRLGLEELRRLVVNPGGNVPIPLSDVAELTVNEGPSEIRRVDQQRAALITANIRGADLATASRDIFTAMSSLQYPTGFSFTIAGQNKEMQTSLNSLLLAFALALFMVYIVMASQFESLVQPLLIMVTVPLALIGVIVALWLGGIPLSIMVFLGLIILAGIVVNNAIVLVDYINTLRDRGLDLTSAIVEAGRARLRPILMTTLTTVLGLVPMALGLGEGAEIRAPMAITVIVGLTISTLLTLVVIPTLYYQFGGTRGPSGVAIVELPPATTGAPPTPELVAK
jgi:multidrug efflux pump subunit AcrB